MLHKYERMTSPYALPDILEVIKKPVVLLSLFRAAYDTATSRLVSGCGILVIGRPVYLHRA